MIFLTLHSVLSLSPQWSLQNAYLIIFLHWVKISNGFQFSGDELFNVSSRAFRFPISKLAMLLLSSWTLEASSLFNPLGKCLSCFQVSMENYIHTLLHSTSHMFIPSFIPLLIKLMFIEHQLCPRNQHIHSLPSVSTGHCFQDSPWTPNFTDPQVSYIKWGSICKITAHTLPYNLNHLQITYDT